MLLDSPDFGGPQQKWQIHGHHDKIRHRMQDLVNHSMILPYRSGRFNFLS